MLILSYVLAAAMGVVLGLLGGGGSILTVPILAYVVGLGAVEATAYSLFIVGVSAAIAAVGYYRRGQVDLRVGSVFAVPAIVAVYVTRKVLVPNVPEYVLGMTKDQLMLLSFAVVMLIAAVSMIRGRKESKAQKRSLPLGWILLEGLVVGVVTGFIGAGGGFLIIPALVLLAGLEMKVAVGTSLAIIAVKSLLGFVGDVQVAPQIQWEFLLVFSALSVVGIFGGMSLSKKVPAEKLKKLFGWFVLVMGVFILLKELL